MNEQNHLYSILARKLISNGYLVLSYKTYNAMHKQHWFNMEVEMAGAKREPSKHITGHYLFTL